MSKKPKKRRILLIDDDKISVKLMRHRLEQNNFDVATYHDGLDIVSKIEESKCELVLLDIVMPKVSGIEVLEEIRKQYNSFSLPVIMVTAQDGDKEIVRCLNMGASDYVTKPVDINVALARMNTQLNIIDLNEELLDKKALETLQSMIVTYNHEINNPLTIALGNLERVAEEVDHPRIKKVEGALARIADIVKKIAELQDGKVKVEQYTEGVSMVSLKKTG